MDSGEKWKFGGESFSLVPTEGATVPSVPQTTSTGAATTTTMCTQTLANKTVLPPAVDTAPIPCLPRGRLQQQCLDCEAIPNTPPAPPKKRHCRSLSIPGDSTGKSNSGRKWQPSGSSLWRPVALRSHHNNNNRTKNRNSPLGYHHHHHHHHRSQEHRSHGGGSGDPHHRPHDHHIFHCNQIGTGGGSVGGHQRLTAVRSSSPTFSISTASHGRHGNQQTQYFPPVTKATTVVWPLSKSEDFSTPPESPVPRPHSASSGFESYGSLNSFWPEAPSSVFQQRSTGLSLSGNSRAFDAFRLRSLSMEEPASKRSISMCSSGAGSMPAIPGSSGGSRAATQGSASMPSSPRRHRVPRCRSQPCVLHDRKTLKRRRDEERPKLDFLKMKEVSEKI